MNLVDISIAKKYTDDSLAGAGAVAGVPCQIQSITDIAGGKRVTFLWEDNNGTEHTSAMDVMNGEPPVSSKTVLFLGDSYGSTTDIANPWTPLVFNTLTFKKRYSTCLGGHGFTGKDGATKGTTGETLRWLTDLTTFVGNHTEAELAEIDDVYIIGGFNDIYSTYETIKNYMSEFFTYAHANLPNARFHLGMSGWVSNRGSLSTPNVTTSGAQFRQYLGKVARAYSECGEYGCSYMGDLFLSLHNYPNDFDNTGYHPSASGARKLANSIISYILGNYFTITTDDIEELVEIVDENDTENPTEKIAFYASQSKNIINVATRLSDTNATLATVTTKKAWSRFIRRIFDTDYTNFNKSIQMKSGLVSSKVNEGSSAFLFPVDVSYIADGTKVNVPAWGNFGATGYLSLIPTCDIPISTDISIRIRPFSVSAKDC